MTDTAPVALITGSARRIGAAIARQFHACGWSVVLHAHTSTTELQQMAFDMDMLRPGSVLALQADLRDAETVAQFGRLDTLVNNASNFYPTLLGQVTAAQWDDLFAVNARAPLLLAQAAAPHLRRQQGSIVNLTDLHGTQPMRDHPVYAAAKAALMHYTTSQALALAPQRIRVNAIAPGSIEFEDGLWARRREQDPELYRNTLAKIPFGCFGEPAAIANAALFLCSPLAGWITGHTLNVDGGQVLMG